jgi:NADP-reducing hydrogenase subunit HndB
MNQVKSLADLKKMKDDLQGKLKLREKGLDAENLLQVRVAMGTCGIASGAKAVMGFLMEELDKRNIDAVVTQTGCMGNCFAEPVVEVSKPGRDSVFFGNVDIRKAEDIIEKYILKGELIGGILSPNVQTIDHQ